MSNGSEIIPYVYHVSSSLLTTSYNVLMGLVISIYIILDMKKLKRSARKVVYALSPKKKEQEVWETMKQCSHIFNGFLIGKMIDSLIIGILCLIAMSILKLPYSPGSGPQSQRLLFPESAPRSGYLPLPDLI